MEDTSSRPMEGQALIDTVVDLTGLPKPQIQKELTDILEKSGHEAENVTIDDLREAMIQYLEQFRDEFIEEHSEKTERISN